MTEAVLEVMQKSIPCSICHMLSPYPVIVGISTIVDEVGDGLGYA